MPEFALPEIAWPPPEMAIGKALTLLLPAMALAMIVFSLLRMAGEKQAPGGAAIALVFGALLGLCISGVAQAWDTIPKPELFSAYDRFLALCFASARALAECFTLIPGESPWNRVPWAALGLLCVGRVVRLPKIESADAWIVRSGAAIAVAWWVIPEDSRVEIPWLAPAFAFVILALWVTLDWACAEPPGGTIPLVVGLAFFAASVVLIHAGSQRLMEDAVALSSALFGIALVAWWLRADTGGISALTAVLLPSLLLMGQQSTYSEVPWYAFALPAVAPLMLALTLPMRDWNNIWLRLLQIAAVLLPLGAAVWFVLQTGPLRFE